MQAGEHQMGVLGWTGDNGDPDNFLFLLGCKDGKPAGQKHLEVVQCRLRRDLVRGAQSL